MQFILYTLHNHNITINIFVMIVIFVIRLIMAIILASIAFIFASLSYWVADTKPITSSVFSLIVFKMMIKSQIKMVTIYI